MDEMQAALDKHNELRARHGAPPLEWSDSCCANAQVAANRCERFGRLEHSNHSNQGQNLYWHSSRSNPVDATQSWYNEVEKYDYNKPGFSQNTGHFTQLVWKSTTHVGIAVSSNGKYLAANYSPSGNVTGRFRENVLPPQPRPLPATPRPVPTNQDIVTINPQCNPTTNPSYIVSCHGTYLSMCKGKVTLHVNSTTGSSWRLYRAGEGSMFAGSLWIQNVDTGQYLRGGYDACQRGPTVVDSYHEHWDYECWWTKQTKLDNGQTAYYIFNAMNQSNKRPKYIRGDPGDHGAVLLTENDWSREKWRFVGAG